MVQSIEIHGTEHKTSTNKIFVSEVCQIVARSSYCSPLVLSPHCPLGPLVGKHKGHLRPLLRFQVICIGTLDDKNVFKICNYCRESCVLLIFNCTIILKTLFSFKIMSFYTIFNTVDDSVKNKGHLTKKLLWNKTLSNLHILVSKFIVTVKNI